MRQSLAIVAALASTATAQSASSLTFWAPGPANNPSRASRYHGPTTSFPPVASIVSSDSATTVFALGCPTSTGAPSSIFNGQDYETCTWATDYATYTIISSTRHIMHRTQDLPQASMWWSCDYNTAATKMTCDLEISGDVNDNTGGPIDDVVWGPEPDKAGNVIALATAEVVTAGRFGELECNIGYQSSKAGPCNSEGTGGKGTRVWSVGSESVAPPRSTSPSASANASAPSLTASQGGGSGSAATASSTASGSAATASTGAAGGFGVDAVKLAALVVGGAAVAAW